MQTLIRRIKRASVMDLILVGWILLLTLLIIFADATVHFHSWPYMLAGVAVYICVAGTILEGRDDK
ncbi:hypothetical protein N007_05490 [Alicyclobacillus acidoterrestris ATCC 49025]|nr:hypothetical protein N007_05490 [Alicyclobacillus acidoterrestris ATCC 49025]